MIFYCGIFFFLPFYEKYFETKYYVSNSMFFGKQNSSRNEKQVPKIHQKITIVVYNTKGFLRFFFYFHNLNIAKFGYMYYLLEQHQKNEKPKTLPTSYLVSTHPYEI